MKGRYSIAEHGWKGEETVDDRKKHKKEKTPTQNSRQKALEQQKGMSTKHMGKA